jgi:hypothetical protein
MFSRSHHKLCVPAIARPCQQQRTERPLPIHVGLGADVFAHAVPELPQSVEPAFRSGEGTRVEHCEHDDWPACEREAECGTP